ncbi:MAG: O-antigen ligase family protein [Smithellaceae bacterium]|nr:O-antigen ligase family protein [Smithellaceae bacterium]
MTILDKVIEKGIIFLLIFTPLAFGTVQQWSVSIMEIAAFSILFLYLIKRTIEMSAQCHSSAGSIADRHSRAGSPPERHSRESGNPVFYESPRGLIALFILFAFMIALILFQMLPLPESLLQVISPAALATYRDFGNYPPRAYHPISLNPFATRQALFSFLSYGAVFFVIVGHYRTKAQVASLVKTILCLGFFLVIFAVLQKATWNGRIYWIYPVDEILKSGVRIWGPYISYNNFAGYLAMAIPLGMGLLLHTAPDLKTLPNVPLRARIARFWASDKLESFTLYFLLVLIMTAALFMTFSRGGIISFVLSAIFFARITRRRRTLRKKTAMLALLAAAILAAVVFASWDGLERRFADLEHHHVSRLSVWQDSLWIVRDYPAIGTGLGTFEDAYMRYQTTQPRVSFDHAHNDYLELLTDIGIVGFLLAAAMTLFFFLPLFRRWKTKRGMFGKCLGAGGLSSCLAIAAHSFVDFDLHIPANALLFAVVCAITYAAIFNITANNKYDYSQTRSEEPSPSSGEGEGEKVSPKWRDRVIYASILLLAVVMLSFPVRDLAADYRYRQVSRILDDKTTEGLDALPISESSMPAYLAAIESLKKAAALSPTNALYQRAQSDIYDRLGKWSEAMLSLNSPIPAGAPSKKEAAEKALSHLKKAISLEPTNPDYHLALGKMYDWGGEPGPAEKALKKTAAAYPVNAPLRYTLAMHYLLTGRKGDALEQARTLAKIDDSYVMRESRQKDYTMERQTPGYLSWLSRSYLYSALEIAWRVSRDPQVIRGIAPDNRDASQVVELFVELRGLR